MPGEVLDNGGGLAAQILLHEELTWLQMQHTRLEFGAHEPIVELCSEAMSIYLLKSATFARVLTIVDNCTCTRRDRKQADVDFRVRTLTEHVLDDAHQGRRRARYGEGFAVELVDKGGRGVQGGESSRKGSGAVLRGLLQSVDSFSGQLWFQSRRETDGRTRQSPAAERGRPCNPHSGGASRGHRGDVSGSRP